MLGRLSFKAQEQGVHHQQQQLLPFGEWCLLDWLGVTWEPPRSCGVEPRSLEGQGDRLLHEDLPRARLVLRGSKPWWNRQGCFFVDPSWVEPSVDSHSRYPPWVEVSINVDVR